MLIKVVKSVNFKEAHIANHLMHLTETFAVKLSQIAVPDVSIGNPGSLSVTRDITQVNYREHMRRSLGLKICWKMEIKIGETYHVASFCCP